VLEAQSHGFFGNEELFGDVAIPVSAGDLFLTPHTDLHTIGNVHCQGEASMGSPKTLQNKKIDRRSAAAGDFLRLVVDTIPALVVSALPDGSVDFINKGWRDYTGLTLESLTGWGWNAALHPDDLNRFVTEWDAARAAGRPYQNQARVRRADGVYRWFLIRKTPLQDESGRISKWYGAGYDIEDLKRTEDDLQRSEFYLAEAQRLAHLGSWVFDPQAVSTTGRLNCFRYTVLIRPKERLALRNTWHSSIHKIASSWHR
jgi:PAS domain S-box-containing protein